MKFRSRRTGEARTGRTILIGLLVLLAALTSVVLLAGRPIAFSVLDRMIRRKFPSVAWISTDSLARWRADTSRPQPVLLDARTQEEFALGHLDGAARIDPYRPNLYRFKVPKDTPIVVYSAAGYRSARVADRLMAAGYQKVSNLDGSLFRWVNEGRLVFAAGHPVEQVHPYDGRWGLLLRPRYRADAVLPEDAQHSAAP